MRQVLKWVGILLGSLGGLIIVALVSLYFITEAKLNQTFDVPIEAVSVPSDPASIERGQHLVTTIGLCSDCHGENLAGQAFNDGPLVGQLTISNLTSGRGGIAGNYTDADWVRAIRHGIGPDGKSLVDMPSNVFYHLSDADLGAMIAYLKSLPPVENELPPISLGPIAWMYILQEPSLLPAHVIKHTAPRPPVPEAGVTMEYGQYLSTVCTVCHGEDLAGEPGAGTGTNLTPAGNLGHWSEADFIHALRTGVTPDDRQLDPELMPWDAIGQLSDDELKAIWLYLQSLPAIETENS